MPTNRRYYTEEQYLQYIAKALADEPGRSMIGLNDSAEGTKLKLSFSITPILARIKSWSDIRFKGARDLTGDLKVVSIYRENGRYWASLPLEVTVASKPQTGAKTAVDVNVGHLNYTAGKVNTLPRRLQVLYRRIKHYQRQLARKRAVNGK